jgi:serine/tyrosine/threonine adenylyltransferase
MFAFDNTYARTPERFYARVAPTRVRAPRIFYVNRALAAVLGIDPDALDAEVLAGNVVPAGAEPIAQAYAGHQFGSFVPRLGDGRAILLGELVGQDGVRRDVQLKGAGRTPFSRGGDGRAAVGPVMREVIVSEAMAALGIPTTRALAAVTTGEQVFRDEPLPGAVLARVASSHLRVGTFEYFAAQGDTEALATLCAYALARHYPDAGEGPLALLDQVVGAHASLVARWLGVGFVHGVMNTDNTSISGETLDYGPCAFLDEYDPDKRFSSIDHGGRYAFANQPRVALWNLARFAETLLPLVGGDPDEAVRAATQRLERFGPRFEAAHAAVLRAKLGLAREEERDLALAEELHALMAADAVDYTLLFRRLCDAAADTTADAGVTSLFRDKPPVEAWLAAWHERVAREAAAPAAVVAAMRRANPAFIPRNHRIEEAIDAFRLAGDLGPFHALMAVLARPYDDQPEHAALAAPPAPSERVERTFCGT